ncbi:MAG: DNA ligase D [Planctomycetota bacterium]|nr:DNA ligase D [Planctomycetota bacterium]
MALKRTLTEYARKRDFSATPEPPPNTKATSRQSSLKATKAKAALAPRSKATAAPASRSPSGSGRAHPAPRTKKESAKPGLRENAYGSTVVGARSEPLLDHPRLFVVQKHAATNLHYDLRLRVGDVLRSWAVPKGPSFDPREKRLAVEVEDHPVEYAAFEGVIPEGNYGGGEVMVWDRGTWSIDDAASEHQRAGHTTPKEALASGMLKFRLQGQRLKGRWMLVRTKREERQPQWLLIKERDAEASAGVHAETFATSVVTGRTMDEIARHAPARSDGLREQPAALTPAGLSGARAAPMPRSFKPQLAAPCGSPPEGEEWLHEVKFDGYRLLAFKAGPRVRLLSRRGLDWTSKLPRLAEAIAERLSVDAIVDGEAVILDARGVSSFQALQNAIHGRRGNAIVFMAFDLPWCDGNDLTRCPLIERRALLESLIGRAQDGRVRFSEHLRGNGAAVFERACAGGLEGIISKRHDAPYVQWRGPAWLKIKCFNQQDFVIAGFTEPEGSREKFGAVLVGYFEGEGKARALRFAGKVGTGFSTETLRQLSTRFVPLVQPKPAFADPPRGVDARGVTWLRPQLVGQVQFREWSDDGVIRHASFRGLREDVDAATITRDRQAPRSSDNSSRDQPNATDFLDPPENDPSNDDANEHTSTRTAGGVAKPKTPRKRADESSRSGTWRITSPERIVFPDRGVGFSLTKRQVADYFERVADRILPEISNRPLSIVRCPGGVEGKCFFQKHISKGLPEAVESVDVDGPEGEAEPYLLVRNVDGLMGLVQMNAIELHPWGSRAGALETPDRVIFDLDPGEGVAWKRTAQAAFMLRDALTQVGLASFARVSGGKGVHVVVPITPTHGWARVKSFAKGVADAMVRLAPRQFIATMALKDRPGKIFLDYLRNGRGATAIASYCLRARAGAPVALPVAWDELPGLESGKALAAPAVLRRLEANEPDPWAEFEASARPLPG